MKTLTKFRITCAAICLVLLCAVAIPAGSLAVDGNANTTTVTDSGLTITNGNATTGFGDGRPYPPSTVITGITFDQSTLLQTAPGSDQWGYTQASDGNLYLDWGDGGGFGGTNTTGRVSMGIARIIGTPPSYTPRNIWGGVNPLSAQATIPGKVGNTIISVNGTIYIYVDHQDVWTDNVLWKSTDLGLTWTEVGPMFNELGGVVR
jgi:hypothetical protein